MLGTYASAALICAASLLVGRALLSISGRREWSWLEPAVGFGAIVTVTGLLARVPGSGTTATLGAVALLLGSALVCFRERLPVPRALLAGLPVALAVALVLTIPFLVSGRWGMIGVGFNNDLGLHLAWAEWLRSGFGPEPFGGYPLGPHGLAVAVAAFPGLTLGQAFLGEIFAISILIGLTALAALGDLGPARRTLAAAMVALTYLAASYFAQGAFKETAEALFVLAFALALRDPGRLPTSARLRVVFLLPYLALAGGVFFAYSFAGLAWPIAILALWGLTEPHGAQGAAARGVARAVWRPRTLVVLLGLAGLTAARPGRPLRLRRRLQQGRRQQHLRPGLPGRGVRGLAGVQLPPRRRNRRRPPDRPGRRDRGAGARLRRRLVAAPARARRAGRARRLRRPLPRLPALQRRLLAGEGADDRRAAGDAGRDPPPARRARRAAPDAAAARLGGAGGRLRRRRRSTRPSWHSATRRSGRPGTAPS